MVCNRHQNSLENFRSEFELIKGLLDLKSQLGRIPKVPRKKSLEDLIDRMLESNVETRVTEFTDFCPDCSMELDEIIHGIMETETKSAETIERFLKAKELLANREQPDFNQLVSDYKIRKQSPKK
jgi:hypothetical protein